VKPVRFRRSAAISIAGLVAILGAVPLATSGFGMDSTPWWAYPLLLVLLVPVFVAIWGWRAGTDADAAGLRIRGAFRSRRIAWTDIAGFETAGRGVVASLAGGEQVALPAVGRADLPRLIAASGTELVGHDDGEPAAGTGSDQDDASDEIETDAAQSSAK
jgi:hypothetical protein